MDFNAMQDGRTNLLQIHKDHFDTLRSFGHDDSFRMVQCGAHAIEAAAKEAGKRYSAGESVKVVALRANTLDRINREIQRRMAPVSGKLVVNACGKAFIDGDRVMVARNGHKYNREVGEEGILHINVDSSLNLEFPDGGRTKGNVNMDDIALAYAVGLHGNIRMQYDTVLVVMNDEDAASFTREDLYTAISMAEKEAVIFIETRSPNNVMMESMANPKRNIRSMPVQKSRKSA